MSVVKGCDIPDDLFYDIENNVWARREADGTLTVGMTAYGCALAGQIVSIAPRKVGRSVRKAKSCATVESGKWVGPVKAPVSGEVVAVNEALLENPGLVNEDPYGAGWIVRLRPDDWDAESGDLLTGEAALAAFAAKMDADGFTGC